MKLGATTRFSQSEPLKWLSSAQDIGVDLVRDGVVWSKIEYAPGKYEFEGNNVLYPETLDAAGVDLILLFGRPQAYADGGATPYTDAGRAGFAKFVSAVLDRFPSVTKIEIGNEFNGNNFVSGPVKKAPYRERDDYYVELLKAVHDKLEQTHPDVEILGGAAHSVPVGYLRNTFELGALDYSDGIAVHPYTSAPEHIGNHIALLKAAMGNQQQPIYVTEFSQPFDSREEAAPYLIKMSAAMAAAGVEAATWFMLRETDRWANRELIDRDGNPTAAGNAFSFMQDVLNRGNAVDVSPEDGLARAIRFGETAMVLWGVERDVTLSNGARAYSAEGELLGGPIALDPSTPIIVLSSNAVRLGTSVKLKAQDVVGDSFLQFDVTNTEDGSESFEGPWSWHYKRGDGLMSELVTVEGGQRDGSIWKPYLGDEGLHPILATETNLRPIDFSNGNQIKARYSVVERFEADQAMTVSIEGTWDVGDGTKDGIDLTVFAGGERIFTKVIRDAYTLNLRDIDLAAGDTIDFEVGVNVNSTGDMTQRSIQIIRTGEGAGDDEPAPPEPPAPPPGDNNAPVIVKTPSTVRLDEGDSKSYLLSKYFADPDGDALRYTITDGPGYGDIIGRKLVIAPGADDSGVTTLSVVASDGQGAQSDELVFSLRVSDAPDLPASPAPPPGDNEAPVIVKTPSTVRLDEGDSKSYLLSKFFADPDGDALRYTITDGPGYGDIIGRKLVIAPGADDSGVTTLSVVASDGQGAQSDELVFNLRVSDTLFGGAVNGTPQSVRLDAGGSISYKLARFFTDPEEDRLDLKIADGRRFAEIADGEPVLATGAMDSPKAVSVAATDGQGFGDDLVFDLRASDVLTFDL
jgi:hypothetical protein